MPPGTRSFRSLKSAIVRIGFFEWMMFGPVVDAVDVVQALLGEHVARRLQAAVAVEEDVPLVRIAQAHQVGAEERGRRQLAGPVQRERVHRLEHAVLDAVEQLEVADDLLGRERLELELAAGLLLDRRGPGLEGRQADAGRPRGLHLPGRRRGRLRVADERRAEQRSRAAAVVRTRRRVSEGPAVSMDMGLLAP